MPSDLDRLRELLAEAERVARDAGDDRRAEPAGMGYFAQPAEGLLDAVERIAAHRGPIALFAGAGVSMEAGLPSWSQLLWGLLEDVAHDLDGEQRRRWLEATLGEGPLAAAAIARSLHPEGEREFVRALRAALYRDGRPRDYVPGALAGQIAGLKRQLGPRLRLLTANYDGLLETALDELGLEPASYVRAVPEPEGRAAVWHLHGRIMRGASGRGGWLREGGVVLSESDYARSTYGTWPQAFVAQQLREALCVFVGMSMTDPNFVRWLSRHGGGGDHEHAVVFVRQAAPELDDAVRRKLEASASARWSRYGVRPVWANYYGEVAQMLHEVGLRLGRPRPPAFAARAARRWQAGRRALAPDEGPRFVEAQRDASGWCRALLHDVRRVAAKAGAELGGEELGLGIWGVDHAAGTMELWATSDRALTRRAAIEQRSVHVFSRWVAVAALTRGFAVEQDPAVYTTRWRFVRALPIVVEPTGQRSIVGAVTLASTTPLEACPLSQRRAPPGLLVDLDRLLSDAAAQFFVA